MAAFHRPAVNWLAVTIHRPSNVDEPETLARLVEVIDAIQARLPLVFPVHPRTWAALEQRGLAARLRQMPAVRVTEPLGYLDFLALERGARLVLTDSGGIQEETTYLGVPCLTVRPNTERPITVTMGTNILVGEDKDRLSGELKNVLAGRAKKGVVPPLWDGHAGERIADILQHA